MNDGDDVRVITPHEGASSGRLRQIVHIATAGVLSSGIFFLQLGLTVFSVRQTLKKLDIESDPASPADISMTVITGISTGYALFFTFYLSTYFKLAPCFHTDESTVLNDVENRELEVEPVQMPKPLKVISAAVLSAEVINLFFSSYLVTAEITQLKSQPALYAITVLPFASNCVTYFIFTYGLASKNISYLYQQILSGEYNGKKMALSVVGGGLATVAQTIAVNYFFQHALNLFPPTQEFSPELVTGLSATMAVLYAPFAATLGIMQIYRYLMNKEQSRGNIETNRTTNRYDTWARLVKIGHYMMQFLYIFTRSSITYASTLDLIARLDSEQQLTNGARLGCAIPVVLSYAAYEYFFMCRTGDQNAKKLINRRGCFFAPAESGDGNPSLEMRLLSSS